MMRPTFFSILLCAFLLVPLYGATEMVVGLDRSVLYEGETLLYQIVLKSDKPVDDAVLPDLSAFVDFHVEAKPKQLQSAVQSSSVVIVNGKMVQNNSTTLHNVAFTYVLTPRRIGELMVPPPKVVVDDVALLPQSVRVDGRTLRPTGNGAIPITVQPPNGGDVVRLEISTDKEQVYPFQPITVTLKVHIKELVGRFAHTHPLALCETPPQLLIPWVEDSGLPKGLQPVRNHNAWLTDMLVVRGRQQGFSINGLADRSFSFGFGFDDDVFGRRSLLQFLPTPVQVQQPDADGKDRVYWEYTFSRTFVPQEFGPLTFGPANIKGLFAVASSTSEAELQRIYAIAPSVNVQVIDVPKANRPTEYIGAFGSFRWNVELQPRQASVGDPLTLTLSLIGRGSTVSVVPPDLANIPEIAENFRVYPPSEEIDGEVCVFTYTVRPTAMGNVVLPSIPITVFDTEKEEFVTLSSEPIALDVTASETLNVALLPVPLFGGELERSPDGLYANMTHGLVDQSVNIVRWVWTMASLLIGYVVLAGSVFAWKRWNADPVRRRRRGAIGRAKRRLAEITTADTNALQGVLIGYVADLTTGVEQGMTPKDVCVRLMNLDVPGQKVAEVRGVLEALDGARFGGLDLRSYDDIALRVRRLLDEISGTTDLSSQVK